MVKLNKIYTRTGDDGTTGLGDGARVAKNALRVEAYGTVDEANALIGVARLHAAGSPLDAMLARIQNDLFDLGADLCTPDRGTDLGYEPLRIVASQVEWLEQTIDELNGRLDPLRSFVLPAGSALSAHLHVARTVIRRAERLIVGLAQLQSEPINAHCVRYANRLSDLLFVIARIANDSGKGDVLWVPGKNR
jgi:cob(I)alamin adenosyltransferase